MTMADLSRTLYLVISTAVVAAFLVRALAGGHIAT
jgi:hypothetical protein